jgi:hypothetical protein
MARPKTRLTQKIEAIAHAFELAPSTVRRWHNEGCNIFDAGELTRWREAKIENRRHKRGDLESALNGHRRDSAGILNLELIEKLPPPSGEGAAAALKRLQGLESIFYSRQLEALAKGRSDLISYALSDYRKITESLRMYEREVELAMRDSGQLISRSDAEKGAEAVARWFRLGWRLWLSSCTPDLLQFAGEPRMFKAKAEETFSEIMKTVFAKAREAKLPVPAWAMPAIREEYRSEIELDVSKTDPVA